MNEETRLFEELPDRTVRCLLCLRRCVIDPGERGHCTTRLNRGGELHSLIHGLVASRRVAPAEIKPLYHFYPGSRFLSLGSVGCNFRCPGCQNWEVAHFRFESEECLGEATRYAQHLSPEEVVKDAVASGCRGISWTYNEPTLWLEYTLETAELAKARGLLTNYVTNGALSRESLSLVAPYLDAFRVDLKAFSPEAYRRVAGFSNPAGVRQRVMEARHRYGIHVELVTNVIPALYVWVEELRPLARWIRDSVGADTPWHLTRFAPHGTLGHLPPTPVELLEEARRMAMDEGLRFVYLGNVPGHPAENTYCPRCGTTLIERAAHQMTANHIRRESCPSCGEKIPGVGI